MDILQSKLRSLVSGVNSKHGVVAGLGKADVRRQQAPHPIPEGLADAACPFAHVRSGVTSKHEHESHDLTEVRKSIHAVLQDPSHDDGSFAPLLIRFAWHLCGTYDKESKTGGSNGATMRFAAEANDPENAGFDKAKACLKLVHEKHSWLSLADLWVLAGYVAIEALGGPRIRFAHGRKDLSKEEAVAIYGKSGCPFGDGKFNPSGSRLPAADLGPDESVSTSAPMCLREAPTINAIRGTFARMGINDREAVALILLGHQFGRCHREVSGYEGAWWSRDVTAWNSDKMGFLYCAAQFDWEYEENPCVGAQPINPKSWRPPNADAGTQLMQAHRMKGLDWTLSARPHPTLPQGKRQYDNTARGRHIMMLISDMCLTWDPQYRQHLQEFRNDRKAFRLAAAAAWKKLTELGCEGLLVEEAAPF